MTKSEHQECLDNLGFENRGKYLRAVAEQYDMDVGMVCELAGLLGRGEDFDGLLSGCADYKCTTVSEVRNN